MYSFWRKPGTMRWAVFAFTSYSVVARCHLLSKYHNFQKDSFEAKELHFILFSKKLHWIHTLKWQREIRLPFSIGLSPKVPVFKSRLLCFLLSMDHNMHQSISNTTGIPTFGMKNYDILYLEDEQEWTNKCTRVKYQSLHWMVHDDQS